MTSTATYSAIPDLLAQAAELLRAVTAAPLTVLRDEDVCLLLAGAEEVGRLVDSARVGLAAEVAERSRYELGSSGLASRLGHTRPAHLIEQVTSVSQREATRRMRLGAAVRPRAALDSRPLPAKFPAVSSALIEGNLGIDSADAIVSSLLQAEKYSSPDPTLMAEAECTLVAVAAEVSADLVADRARVYRELLDPDGAEPRAEERYHRRGFRLGRDSDGMTPFRGWADPASAGLLRAMLSEGANPKATPRFLSEEDSARGSSIAVDEQGEEVLQITDTRTPEATALRHTHGHLDRWPPPRGDGCLDAPPDDSDGRRAVARHRGRLGGGVDR